MLPRYEHALTEELLRQQYVAKGCTSESIAQETGASGATVDNMRCGIASRPVLAEGQPLYAVACSVWARCAAATSPERGYSHHSARHTGGVPVVAGWSSQGISQLSFRRDRGTAPLDVPRVPRSADVTTAAALQIKALLPRLPADGAVPFF